MEDDEIVLFESRDGAVSLPVSVSADTVWLSQVQMAQLFGKDRTVIGRHIRNAISDGEIVPETMCAKIAHLADNVAGSVKIEIYNLEPNQPVGLRLPVAERAHGVVHRHAHRVEVAAEMPHAPCGQRGPARARVCGRYAERGNFIPRMTYRARARTTRRPVDNFPAGTTGVLPVALPAARTTSHGTRTTIFHFLFSARAATMASAENSPRLAQTGTVSHWFGCQTKFTRQIPP